MTTILLVDDEVIELKYLSSIFGQHPGTYHVVGQAENGEQAVALALLHKPDVVILDINMPLLNGLDAARRIRQHLPEQIIIINSAHTEFEMAHRALTDQLDAYLLKPTPVDAVFATVQTCLSRKRVGGRPALAERPGRVQYPYALVDNILSALTGEEPARLAAAAAEFCAFLRQADNPEDYRLYVINALFSVEQALCQNQVGEDLLALLDCGHYIRLAGRAESWADVCAACEEFFGKLPFLCKEHRPAPQSVAVRVAGYIDEHYMEDLTLEELAEQVHFSPAYLSRVFHAEMGATLRDYIRAQRVQRATHLLRHSTRMLRDIAGDCGFKNLSHFHRVYKECTGVTPAQARK